MLPRAADVNSREVPPCTRGRPRDADSHARILQATNALLETTAWSELSIEAIAARAKVGKQTIYKWWGGKPSLVMEAALCAMEERVKPVDTGDVAKDLTSFLRRSGRNLRETSAGRILSVMIAETQQHPGFAEEFRARFLTVRRQGLEAVLQRAVARGELKKDTDVATLIDVLFGAFWYRLLSGRAPLTDAFAEDVVALVLPAVLARPKGRG
jgi:AcrR family transcriptional regulator